MNKLADKKKNELILTIIFSISMLLYYGLYSMSYGFISNILFKKGIANSDQALIILCINILSIITQSKSSAFLDRTKKTTVSKFCILMFAAIIVFSAFTILFLNEIKIYVVFNILCYSTILSIWPLIGVIPFKSEKYGLSVDYSIPRGIGSISYAVSALIFGFVFSKFNILYSGYFYIIFCFLSIIMLLLYNIIEQAYSDDKYENEEVTDNFEVNNNTLTFLKNNKMFFIYLIGVVLVSQSHMVFYTYTQQIVSRFGGGIKDIGMAYFISAAIELPVISSYKFFNKKFSNKSIQIFSLIMFPAKLFLISIARSGFELNIIMIMQIFSYALFCMTYPYYVNEVLKKEDIVKGQTLVNICFAISSVVNGIECSILFRFTDITNILYIISFTALIGAIISTFAIYKMSKN